MAADVGELAEAMGFDRYATLGHSYGAFVVLQQPVDNPGHAAATIVSSGAPFVRFLAAVEEKLATFGHSGHITYAEENDAYLGAVRRFLQSVP